MTPVHNALDKLYQSEGPPERISITYISQAGNEAQAEMVVGGYEDLAEERHVNCHYQDHELTLTLPLTEMIRALAKSTGVA